ncbi:hypothetical protein NEOLEDRAFT_1244648 [Neolentinus lepideus HHB14362 ss-1]|uniref:Uncharacterized protein n=1 Tax=Neolentinus lepideus HHB14362 ss-1 TaxID=1314782 RepID=A0A165PNI9_9AGAM|nr:hypothetical protein NEOLEDRAFT_1244648 [Neolentinus lepideus HHB14362 ss-1]
MAAVYIHNALFSPEIGSGSPPSGSRPTSGHGRAPHQRTQSSYSILTLQTATTHTYPTESILHSVASVSTAYHDLLARQPPHPSEASYGWDTPLRLHDGPEVLGYREKTLAKRLRRLGTAKIPLEVVLGGWAIYTTVRYFVAFSFTPAHDIEIISLSVGASSVLSLCLLVASILLFILSPRSWQTSHMFSVVTRILLSYASSVFLIAPAAVNLVLVALLRRRTSVLQVTRLCAWDVDVLWAGNGRSCDGTHKAKWAPWFAGAIVRLVLTIVIAAVYHVIARMYHQTYDKLESHSSFRRSQPVLIGSPLTLPVSASSSLQPIINATTPPMTPGTLSPYFSPSLIRQSRGSYASETGASPPTSASDRRSLRGHRPRIASTKEGVLTVPRKSLSSSGHEHHDTEFDDDLDSEEHGDSSVETVTVQTPPVVKKNSLDGEHQSGSEHSNRHGPAPVEQGLYEIELLEFEDRFRSLVSQVSRETEEGMNFATQPDYTFDPAVLNRRIVNLDADEEEEGDSESGMDARSMTPEDYISMLGGYVRRMPTIESLGSREVMSLTNSRCGTSSRPPTRAATLSMSEQGSQPPSRSNSLNWRQLDIVAAVNNGTAEPTTPLSPSGSVSQRSVVRAGSMSSWRSLGTSVVVESPVQTEFPWNPAHEES